MKKILVACLFVVPFAVALAAPASIEPTPTPKPPITIKCQAQLNVLQSQGVNPPMGGWHFDYPLKNYNYPFRSARVNTFPSGEQDLFCSYAPAGTNVIVDLTKEAEECYLCAVKPAAPDTFLCTWVGCK